MKTNLFVLCECVFDSMFRKWNRHTPYELEVHGIGTRAYKHMYRVYTYIKSVRLNEFCVCLASAWLDCMAWLPMLAHFRFLTKKTSSNETDRDHFNCA